MENNTGINPVGWRILVLPREVTEKTASGIILNTATGHEREQICLLYTSDAADE